MSKITDMLMSAILKKGVLYEVDNCDVEFDIPNTQVNTQGETIENKIKIKVHAEHMVLRIEKE